MSGALYLGIDVGTSGVRALALDDAGRLRGSASAPMPLPLRDGDRVEQDPAVWWQALGDALRRLGEELDLARVRRLAVDGTSGTLVLIDAAGRPLAPATLYNDARGAAAAERIAAVAPPESGAHGATSALARLMTLTAAGLPPGTRHALHQADWIAGRLTGRYGFSDENNALKSGYDPVERAWPAWLGALGIDRSLLPEVREPGTPLGPLAAEAAAELGLPATAEVVAGTTDGVAAFLASGACEPGDGVTSLGTTLVVKLLAERPAFEPASGVYSHRLGRRWLVGGASNSGGAALLRHFTAEEMDRLEPALRPDQPTGLDYYPLPGRGERFPLRDPELESLTEPRPTDPARFLQALLEGIATIEALAYRRLAELGAPPLRRLLTVGGGARNAAWTAIRARCLGVPPAPAASLEAAQGAALLALWQGPQPKQEKEKTMSSAAELESLKRMSARVGSEIALVQGAGGNSSVKLEGILWVKASGTWLADALKSPIFLPLDLADTRQRCAAGEDKVPPLALPGVPPELRPSIETALHALLPQRVVLHVHSVNAIAWCVQPGSRAAVAERLEGLRWATLPYCRPGLPLSAAVGALSAGGPAPDVLLLGNHGLVLAAESCDAVETLLAEVERRLALPERPAPAARLAELERLAAGSAYRPAELPQVHGLATDPHRLELVTRGTLYPDHVIFLGPAVRALAPGEIPENLADRPPVLLAPGLGTLVHRDLPLAGQQLLDCLGLVVARLPPEAAVDYVPDAEVQALLGWDAEQYRRALKRPM